MPGRCTVVADHPIGTCGQALDRGLFPRLSIGTLQLSIRCSSIHFRPMRSFPVSDGPLAGTADPTFGAVWSGCLSCAKAADARQIATTKVLLNLAVNRFHGLSVGAKNFMRQIRHVKDSRWPPGTCGQRVGCPLITVCDAARETTERQMEKWKQLMIAGCSILILSAGAAMAGPCDTGRSADLKDAGSGPAKMGDSQTTGMAADTGQHPPTGTIEIERTGDVAASSQDTQRQMQGEPTAAQQADGAKAGSRPQTRIARGVKLKAVRIVRHFGRLSDIPTEVSVFDRWLRHANRIREP